VTPRAPKSAFARLLAVAVTLLAGLAAAQPAPPAMEGVAAISEGPAVALRWSFPDDVFPRGGFVVTRVGPGGARETLPVPSPLPRDQAPIADDTYDALLAIYDPGAAAVAATDDAFAFLRAFVTLQAAVEPDLARALGLLVEVPATVGDRLRFEVATGDGQSVGWAEITVGSTPPLAPPTGLQAHPTADGVRLR